MSKGLGQESILILMQIRSSQAEELDFIYKMGFDVWSEGSSMEDYLQICRNSSKYKQAEWFVLEDSNQLFSSLLLHSFEPNIYGLGSIATELSHRNKGFASILIEKVIQYLEVQRNAKIIYIYSDIVPDFYTRFGFRPLPAEMQKYPSSHCMVRVSNGFQMDVNKLVPPKYF